MEGRAINKLSIGNIIKYNSKFYEVVSITYTRNKPRGLYVRCLLPPHEQRSIDYYDMKNACQVVDFEDESVKALMVLYGTQA